MSIAKGENNFLDTYIGRVWDWDDGEAEAVELMTVRAFNHKEAEEQVRAEVLKNRSQYPDNFDVTVKRYKHERLVSSPADQYREKEKQAREARIANAKARKRGGKR